MNIKALLSIGVLFFTPILAGCTQSDDTVLTAARSIEHPHGFAADVTDSSKLYIATHDGLFVLKNEKDLYKIGKISDDFMGFSVHPTKSDTFFSSGHPKTGGNIGFQKSEDGGLTWQRISSGAQGPVDFHALTISGANPDLAYGWHRGMIQRSLDGGVTWEIMGTPLSNVIALVADPQDENTIYATSTQGVKVSSTKGKEWAELSEDLKETPVVFLAINPKNSQEMISFSEKFGLAQSSDGGATWEKIEKDFDEDIPLYASFVSPEQIYLLTKSSSIYKSIDSGSTWVKIL